MQDLFAKESSLEETAFTSKDICGHVNIIALDTHV